MAKKRRNSIPLEEFQQLINETLASDQSHSPQWRQGLCAAIRAALDAANNYGGWEFTDEAGIEYELVHGELRQQVKDKTRRRFYTLDEIEEQARTLYAPAPKRTAQRNETRNDPPPDETDNLEVDRIGPTRQTPRTRS